ncbi:MAG: Gfo/Idh/MocA family protein [Anaerolineae bacterium]
MGEQGYVNIGQIGHKFIGKAHTHAYTNVGIFFAVKLRPVKKVLCGVGEDLPQIAQQWGWEEWTQDWREVVARPDIDVVDICAPSRLHKEIAVAAARAGKHVFCEKPLAMSLADAQAMVEAVEEAGVVHTIGFNYRKVPAMVLAKQLIREGAIGRIFHFRGIYSQDWLVDPTFPLAWRLRKKDAGAGSSWDLGAHVVDLARYLVGEIDEVVASQTTFVTQRPVAKIEDGLTAIAGEEMGEVDVDDATSFLARFENGAMGLFEVTRYGTGHRNQNRIEIYGSEGGLIWEGFPKMNDLLFYSRKDPAHAQGFRTIQVGEAVHPYVGAYYPAGHIIGFGETFTHEMLDFLNAIAEGRPASPNFHDGLQCQEILVAVDRSVQERRWVKVSEVR